MVSKEKIIQKLEELNFEVRDNFIYALNMGGFLKEFLLGSMFSRGSILAFNDKKIFIGQLNLSGSNFSSKVIPVILDRKDTEIIFKKNLFFYATLILINKNNPKEKIKYKIPKFLLGLKFQAKNIRNIFKDVNKKEY